LCNTFATEIKKRDQIVLCVILSRIVALLLDKERISYSCFKIPLSIYEDSVTGLKHNSYIFLVLQQTRVIIWDEVSM